MSENKFTQAAASSSASDVILEAKNLKKYFPIRQSALLAKNRKVLHAVDGVSFQLHRGKTLGLVGESGCGKSTTGRLLVGIEKPTEGEVLYQGKDLLQIKGEEFRKARLNLQMIFQDPYASLNPRKRVIDILSAPMLCHGLETKDTVNRRVDELLDLVGLPHSAKMRYPHEFSGGQRQRITIARALALKPEVIVCDEPVSALDASIQAQILNLLRSLQKDLGVAYLFIAHGLGAVHYISDEIAVMYLGKIVETGEASAVFHHPAHPYAQLLIRAVPSTNPDLRNAFHVPDGEVPSAIDLPRGCRFAARCPYATDRCRQEEPTLLPLEGRPGHLCACFYPITENTADNNPASDASKDSIPLNSGNEGLLSAMNSQKTVHPIKTTCAETDVAGKEGR